MAKQNIGGLGRGLGSLIPNKADQKKQNKKEEIQEVESSQEVGAHGIDERVSQSQIMDLPIDSISSNEHQPRKFFEEKKLQELSDSIKEHGILQPLVVVKKDEGYELIAGERRLRASKLATLERVPCIIRDVGELERLELAMIENIQRADLNPIEEAQAYQKMNDDFGLTHDQISKRLGKSRPVISNSMRLLGLPDEVQRALSEGKITEGHAKVLLEIKDNDKRLALFKRVLGEKLSITDTAQEVKRVEVNRHTRKVTKDPNIEAYEEKIRSALGTKVSIKKRGKNAGVIVIEYYGEEEFNNLLGRLSE
jgi:ParB family transcriptional regulator, chromosome partitioning protein